VKLAELRKEYERQQAVETALPHAPWRTTGEEITNADSGEIVSQPCFGITDAHGGTVVRTESGIYPPNYPTAEFICFCRNSNSARLEVVSYLLSRDGEDDTAAIAAKLLFGEEVAVEA
jgi:hypothetical protein